MGCCCYSHAPTENDILRVAIFGLENSGKTSLVHCLKTSSQIFQTSKYQSTHGVIAINIHLNIQTNLDLLVFDCGGCKHQRHIWPHFINNSDVILFAVDSHDFTCLNDAKQALFDLLTDESLANKPLLVVFTKSDKRNRISIRRLEQALDLSLIQDRSIHRVLFSSVTLDGLTSISAWFAYFNHCKVLGKEMKIPNNPQSISKKYRIPKSLNLSTSSVSFSSVTSNIPNMKSSNLLTVPNLKKTKTSSSEKRNSLRIK